MIGLMTLLVKSGHGDFEEYQELVRRAASIKEGTNGECVTLETMYLNQLLINRLSGKENQICRLFNSIGAKYFCATRTHLPKFFCTDCENINIHACGGALDAFIFQSTFPRHARFNAFVSVLSFLLFNLTNGFYCKTQAAKNSISTCRN